MNDFVNTALQAFGLKQLAVTKLDVKLLTDSLGRTLPVGASYGQYVGTDAPKWWGQEEDSGSGYSTVGTVFSINNYILSAAAPIPWGAYTLDKKDNQAKPVAPSHPLARLLYRPNPQQTWAQLKRQAEGCYNIKGEFFLRGVRPTLGTRKDKIAEVWCLVGKVEVLRLAENGDRLPLGQFDMPTHFQHTDAVTNVVTRYPADQIHHEKTWNPSNAHRGLSPLDPGAYDVTLARAGKESRAQQYQNQGPKGVVFSKPVAGEASNWTKEQASRIQSWFSSFSGIGRRNSGEIPIVTHELGYLSMGLSPVDLDVLAAIPHDKDALCDLWHFPGELLNGSKGTTFSNASEASTALYNRCVLPLETVFRDALNYWLGPEYEDEAYINFDTSHIPELQEDLKELVETLNAAWWMPVKEKQRRMGLEINWTGPDFVVPSTLMGAEELGGLAVGDEAPKPGAVTS